MKSATRLFLLAGLVFIAFGCSTAPAYLDGRFIGEWDVISLEYVDDAAGNYSSADLTDDPAEIKTAKIKMTESSFLQFNKANVLKLGYVTKMISANRFQSTIEDPGLTDSVVGTVFFWKIELDPIDSDQVYFTGYATHDKSMRNPLAVYTCRKAAD